MPAGGPGRGQGRKKKEVEVEATSLALEAIKTKYGTLQDGYIQLLESREPALVKFVWEHAVGKPKDKIEHSGRVDRGVIFILDDRFNSKDDTGIST